MSTIESTSRPGVDRRTLLKTGVAVISGAALGRFVSASAAAAKRGKPTEFQIACMTLPYGQFSLQRALTGIKAAGYEYVAWGTRHVETPGGPRVPLLPADAPPARAKELGKRCRDMGLGPLMMFSTVYPEATDGLEILTNRVKQAAAAGIPQVLTFGHTEGGNAMLWIERFKKLAPIARDHGVMIVVKQHGGSTGTGEACAKITREVDDPAVMVNFDAGNVMDYLNLDPIPDIRKCADVVRSFCIKDHRNWPKDQDCGPGFGEIDHYRLLDPVAFTGLKMPLCCENTFAPLLARPDKPEGVDDLALRARLFLETVIAGLQA
ncbi:MAG: sugar phosphate isomerase/epimerase [Planctomycetes bacterium]|nr:sugar phosphate isomerase/epimerase [Planctomycetota bacterium]MBL7044713.1 sugar phosphate isomerase/epimerase [Pirellulaceae bacterium]